jgi:hypothetical protein
MALFLWACGSSDKSAPLASTPENQSPASPPSGSAGLAPGEADTGTASSSSEPAPPPPGNSGADLPASDIPSANDDPQAPVEADLPSPSGSGSLEGTFLDLDLFPYQAIVSGGPPKDGIPALTNPRFVDPQDVRYLSDDDLVLGVVINGEARAYPHNIGWWHEIVNDRIGGRPISVTFCPLTGTGLVFDAEDKSGAQFELGVSGLLFNTNLIMYDRRDGSTLYPQIAFQAISGPRKGESLSLLPVMETTWATWKKLYPDTQVIAQGTYNINQYTSYPYGDYRTNHRFFLFDLTLPLNANPNPFSTIFGAKDLVLGVRLDGHPKAYPFSAMGEQQVINDQVGGVEIVVLWDQDSFLAIPYSRRVHGQSLTFDLEASTGFPFSLKDRETGTRWNVRGEALEGPLQGMRLTQVPTHNSMWFAWVTFWQKTEVWQP